MADVLIGQGGGRELRELVLLPVVFEEEVKCCVVRRREVRRVEAEQVHDRDVRAVAGDAAFRDQSLREFVEQGRQQFVQASYQLSFVQFEGLDGVVSKFLLTLFHIFCATGKE